LAVLNLPNALTTVRIIIIPAFATSVMYQRYNHALYLFVAAALTDALDGLTARLKNQRTALGTFLDPLADKFLIVTAFILFSYYGLVPGWLTITVISRDIIVVTGWMLLYMTTHTMKVEPSVLGKAAIALQLAFLCYVLLDINYVLPPGIKTPFIWAVALSAVASGVQYIQRGLKHAGQK